SPGTLTVSGNYTQGAGGRLEIEIGGTGAGQFDRLAVSGNATLGGSLDLQPIGNYSASSAIGDSIGFLAYGGTRTDQFASTTAGALACPKQISTSYDDTGKKVNAVVSSTGAACDPAKPPALILDVLAPRKDPNTVLGKYPKKPVKTKKAKAKISFSFSSNAAAATFECKLDKGKYVSCTSPKSYGLKPGKHMVSVRAVSAGAVDPTPASFSVKVVKRKAKRSK
ncbi:MAG TPA: autotransporter outer membrane beta-barrel domain-containing protein, partial [Solirubrobacterales bacterium]|nr:autotransporter outer membrane beta-barrel domain-containing protein [Solirubrobacterales bacterium]